MTAHTPGSAGPGDDIVEVSVLGPTRAHVAGAPVGLGSPAQRAVLARLVAAGGKVVSTDRLIDDLWAGEPPPRALNALQVHVSNLRRCLEPGRAPRTSARVLVTSPPGYALDLPHEAVDAWSFEHLFTAAVTERDADARARTLARALTLWNGTAYEEFADTGWAGPEVVRLEELRRSAVERWAAAMLDCSDAAAAVPELSVLLRIQPDREETARLLALAHYRCGRQADAMSVLRSTRRYLVDELGLDPGPALEATETTILTHGDSLMRSPIGVAPAPPPAVEPPRPSLVNGRPGDLQALLDEAGSTATSGRRLVWLGGEAGAGKSTLCRLLATELQNENWHIAWGSCPEVKGAPPGWAWRETLSTLTERIPLSEQDRHRLAPLSTDEDDTRTIQPFHLSRALAAYLVTVAASAPLLLVLDDVHRADDLTLQILHQIVSELGAAPVLVVATYRPTDITDALATVWAATAADTDLRLDLSGLPRPGVATVAAQHGLPKPLDPEILDLLVDRTGGNPLFVQQLSRLVVSEGYEAAKSVVPTGVADILRRRLSRLPERTVTALRRMAVLGRELDLDVLVRLIGHTSSAAEQTDSEEQLLDDLEPAVTAGLLVEPAPDRVRFAHTLVRDTLYSDVPRMRRTRIHAAALEALSDLRPDDAAGLAHHAVLSATPATAEAAMMRAVAAARESETLASHRDAAHWRSAALDTYELTYRPESSTLIDLLVPLVTARARAGNIVGAREARRRAVELAGSRGDDERLLVALTSWNAPVIWTLRVTPTIDDAIVRPLRTALDDEPDARTRALLLIALVYELEGVDDRGAADAALEALSLSSTVDDDRVRCAALGAVGYLAYGPDLNDRRKPVADELLAIAIEHRFDDYRVLAHFQLFLWNSSRLDIAGARTQLDNALTVAGGGQLGELVVVAAAYGALCDVHAGRLDAAQSAYNALAELITRSGNAAGPMFHLVGAISCAAATGDFAALVPLLRDVTPERQAITRAVLASALFDAGDIPGARTAWAESRPHPRDYYWLPMTTLRALAAARLEDHRACTELHHQLSAFSGQIAGFESGSLYAGPVDAALAATADVLGNHSSAAKFRASAQALMARFPAESS